MTVSDIISLVAALGSIIAIILAVRKQPYDIKQLSASTEGTEADTAAKYQEIAMKSATRILELEKEVKSLKVELNALEVEVEALRQERDDLKNWAERLVHQIRAHTKLEPVPFKQTEVE